MYFKDRYQAGELIAARLTKYINQPSVVVCLNDGAILVGQRIATQLNCQMTLLLSRNITLPGEVSVLGTVDQSGGLTYNSLFSTGEIDEYVSEFHNYIESEKMAKTSEINRLIGRHGVIDRKILRDKIIILVTDGAKSGTIFDAAVSYLKPVRYKRLIMSTPLAAIPAIDRMHVLSDEIVVLSAVENYIDTDHYYNENNMPESEQLLCYLDDFNDSHLDLEEDVENIARRTYN